MHIQPSEMDAMEAGIDASVSKPTEPAAPKARLSATVEDAALTKSLKLLAEIQAAIKASDVNAIRQTADALKGCITAVLAKRAFEAASTLEQTEHEDDLGRAQDACRRLRAAITSLNQTYAEKTA
jgi:hypothetical protein